VTARGAHVLMAVGMAGMLSPWGDPVPAILGALVFGTLAAWFLSVRLHHGSGLDATAHTAIASAAMAVMYLGHDTGAATPDTGHHHAVGGAVGAVSIGIALLLAAYFLWHAWECTGQIRNRPAARGTTLVTVRGPAVLAHLAMDVLMAVMFLAMV
jgi:Domain of unknown function (DUF5134)